MHERRIDTTDQNRLRHDHLLSPGMLAAPPKPDKQPGPGFGPRPGKQGPLRTS